MSTDTVNQKVPTGTWTVDPVHSSIAFAITHNNVATFRSGFETYEATLSGGEEPKLEGSVDVASDRHRRGAAQGPPDVAGILRHRALPEADLQPRPASTSPTTAASASPVSSRSRATTREVEATGRFGEIGADLGGNPRVALSVATAVDRRDFGIEFNADLPSGGQVLEWEVAINVDLELVAQEA